MDKLEIYKELKMSYGELQQYLLKKYGGAVYDYFHTPECKTKNRKVTRTKEGLYCHHMDEDKGGSLSDPLKARMQPFEWQKKERLVYCNILEHLILHIKIAVMRQKKPLEKPCDVQFFFSTDGIITICSDINDMFMNDGTSVEWKRRCFEEIKDNYADYIILMKTVLLYIKDNYRGEKGENYFLKQGSKANTIDGYYEIVKLTKKLDKAIVKTSTGELREVNTSLFFNKLRYKDFISIQARKMSSGFEEFYLNIYTDIINYERDEQIDMCLLSLQIDKIGYGFSQYSYIELTEDYGSVNADQYISKALPMYSDANIELNNKKPVFWKGAELPIETKQSFYIIRFETMFDIKKGYEPFVKYKEHDLFRNYKYSSIMIDEEKNFINEGYVVLSTSDIYSKKIDKYSPVYIDLDGKTRDATVILTLGRDDFYLFQERYAIRMLKILDGCYFEG